MSARELHSAVLEVIRFLQAHGDEPATVRALQEAADEIAAGDLHGARRYLDCIRPITDVYFEPVHSNAKTDAEVEQLRERLAVLRDHACELAEAAIRNFSDPTT